MTNHKDIIFIVIVVIFLIMTGWFTVSNYPIIFQSVSDYLENGSSIKEVLTAGMESDRLAYKDAFINLNGLYGRLSGRRIYNNVVLMKNGMLTGPETSVNLSSSKMLRKFQNLTEFNDFVSSSGGYFLYVFFPVKTDMENELLPDGFRSEVPMQIESMLESFRNESIDVIDTLPVLSMTAADVEETFYRTDHHWKPTAAFTAYQMIMTHLKEIYPDEPYDEELMKIENWTIHEMPDQFLGSRGKRVGIYFTGLDALQWITPNFDTALSCYDQGTRLFLDGSYEEVFLRQAFLQPNTDYLHTNNYQVYIGVSKLLQIKNMQAPSTQRLLIIQDSFGRPLLTFLAMQFREVYVIDARSASSMTIDEYVNRINPDLVLMGHSSITLLNNSVFEFSGQDDDLLSDERILLLETSGSIQPTENRTHNNVLYAEFEDGKYYTAAISEIIVTDGETDGITVALYDRDSKKIIAETILDISYCSQYGDCEWTFQAPESGSGSVQLIIYAGIRGKTDSVGITFPQFKLYERTIE